MVRLDASRDRPGFSRASDLLSNRRRGCRGPSSSPRCPQHTRWQHIRPSRSRNWPRCRCGSWRARSTRRSSTCCSRVPRGRLRTATRPSGRQRLGHARRDRSQPRNLDGLLRGPGRDAPRKQPGSPSSRSAPIAHAHLPCAVSRRQLAGAPSAAGRLPRRQRRLKTSSRESTSGRPRERSRFAPPRPERAVDRRVPRSSRGARQQRPDPQRAPGGDPLPVSLRRAPAPRARRHDPAGPLDPAQRFNRALVSFLA